MRNNKFIVPATTDLTLICTLVLTIMSYFTFRSLKTALLLHL